MYWIVLVTKFDTANKAIETDLTASDDELYSRLCELSEDKFIDFPSYDDFKNQPDCLGSEDELGPARRVIRGSYRSMSSPGEISMFSENIDISCLRICCEFIKVEDRCLSKKEFCQIRRFLWRMVLHHEHFHYISDYLRTAYPLTPHSEWSHPEKEEALAVAWAYIRVSEEVYQGADPDARLLESFVENQREREITTIYDLVFSYTSPGYRDFTNYVDIKNKTDRSIFYNAIEDLYLSDVLNKLNLIATMGVGRLIEFAENSENWELNQL